MKKVSFRCIFGLFLMLFILSVSGCLTPPGRTGNQGESGESVRGKDGENGEGGEDGETVLTSREFRLDPLGSCFVSKVEIKWIDYNGNGIMQEEEMQGESEFIECLSGYGDTIPIIPDTRQLSSDTIGDASGDDGEVVRRTRGTHLFKDVEPGVNLLFDENTGLVWQGDPTTDTFTSLEDAKVYCDGLLADQGFYFRVANKYEWDSIVDYGKSTKKFIDGINIGENGMFLTSTAVGEGYVVMSSSCGQSVRVEAEPFDLARRVICVQGVELEPVEFEEEGDYVVDRVNGVRYYDPEEGAMTWDEAREYCNASTFGGSSKWVLPDINLLKSLVTLGDESSSEYDFLGELWSSTANTHYMGSRRNYTLDGIDIRYHDVSEDVRRNFICFDRMW